MLQSFSWKEKSILIAQIIIKECNFGGSKKNFRNFPRKNTVEVASEYYDRDVKS